MPLRPAGAFMRDALAAASITRGRRLNAIIRPSWILGTLVWTRERNMPLAGLREHMTCPRCGNRRVNLIFDPPPAGARADGVGTGVQ
jgi:hypothetical protein